MGSPSEGSVGVGEGGAGMGKMNRGDARRFISLMSDSSYASRSTTVVMIEDPPVPFSPFSSADCTMLDHFSFNDFIAIAFPDIAGDLDIQI